MIMMMIIVIVIAVILFLGLLWSNDETCFCVDYPPSSTAEGDIC